MGVRDGGIEVAPGATERLTPGTTKVGWLGASRSRVPDVKLYRAGVLGELVTWSLRRRKLGRGRGRAAVHRFPMGQGRRANEWSSAILSELASKQLVAC
jgi:hypothetical protein